MGGKTKTTTNSSQTNKAFEPVNPVLTQGAGQMNDYLNNPNSNAVYDGPRVADMSGDTLAGLQGLRDSTGANASQDYLMQLLGTPSNVADNPQVQAMQDAIRRQVQATTNSMFSNAGMVGGTAHQGSLAKGLADGLAQPLFAAYQNDQANKLNAAGMLPGVGQQIIGNQMGAGQVLDSYNQNKINADMQKFEEQRTAPIKAWSEIAPLATQWRQYTPFGQMLWVLALFAIGVDAGIAYEFGPRDTIIERSNCNAAVSFPADTKDLTNDLPAERRVEGPNGVTESTAVIAFASKTDLAAASAPSSSASWATVRQTTLRRHTPRSCYPQKASALSTRESTSPLSKSPLRPPAICLVA